MNGRNNAVVWGVLLAGGDGSRLQCLTTRIEGDTRPKQFSRVIGDETLLTQTRRRISPLIEAGKMVTVVTRRHETYFAQEFGSCALEAIVVQPENRGTAVAIGAAILTIVGVDPEAVVAVFPSDHHYGNEAALLDVIEAGILAARENPDHVIVIGAEANYPETEYGWIEPSNLQRGLKPARVRRFWEKPAPQMASDLLRRGCLWNTFVTIGRVAAIVDLLCDAAPNTMLALSAGVRTNDLESCYRSVPPLDFSRDVLASSPDRLLVLRDHLSGWTDLGNPSRVFDTLSREKIKPAWLHASVRVETPAHPPHVPISEVNRDGPPVC